MRSPFDRPIFARARRLCLALPGVTETASWGHPNFRAGRQTFCAFELVSERPSIAFKVSPADLDSMLAQKGGFATPYGRGRWVSVWVDGDVDWKVIESMLQRSYRAVAGKRLLGAFDASRGAR